MKELSFDIHIHLAGNGCDCSGCWTHPKLLKRASFRFLKFLHGITDQEIREHIDENWAKRASELVHKSSIDFGVVLGFDGAYDQNGDFDPQFSQMLIPPSWVFSVAKRYPNLLPGPSINPERKDAREILDYCIEEKAALIKWLPSAQKIDPAAPKAKELYARLAEASIPLLVHCGGERTFASYEPAYNDVRRLESALDMGVKVICAHSATSILLGRERDQFPDVLSFLEKYPNFWLDNSGLCNPGRFHHVPKLAAHPLVRERTLYGSDWPVPSNAFYFAKNISWREIAEFERIGNLIDRDLAVKSRLGYPKDSTNKAKNILANLDFWTNRVS